MIYYYPTCHLVKKYFKIVFERDLSYNRISGLILKYLLNLRYKGILLVYKIKLFNFREIIINHMCRSQVDLMVSAYDSHPRLRDLISFTCRFLSFQVVSRIMSVKQYSFSLKSNIVLLFAIRLRTKESIRKVENKQTFVLCFHIHLLSSD